MKFATLVPERTEGSVCELGGQGQGLVFRLVALFRFTSKKTPGGAGTPVHVRGNGTNKIRTTVASIRFGISAPRSKAPCDGFSVNCQEIFPMYLKRAAEYAVFRPIASYVTSSPLLQYDSAQPTACEHTVGTASTTRPGTL